MILEMQWEICTHYHSVEQTLSYVRAREEVLLFDVS
jgi:hypothetical protein